ncbi:MAG: putative DNA binding domain-containing protein [Kiritimatiellae bacterium]|nr:putative DNA binding domain-containing protein [Kiritimatiellia bacterium]
MNDSIVRDMLRAGESETLACGPAAWAADASQVGRTVCAFANGQGGTLLIGQEGEDVQDADRMVEELRKQIQDRVSPMLGVAVRRADVGKRNLIIVDVPAGHDLPYTWDKQIFVRAATETRAADGLQTRELLIKKSTFGPLWERQVAVGIGLGDLDTKLILRVVSEAEGGKRFLFGSRNDVWEILRELDLAEGNLLRNSAYALFGKAPDKRFPQMRLRAVAYQGTEQDKLADSRMIGGNLYEILDKGLKFLEQHTPISSEVPREGLRRDQKAPYPMPAVREAILNAIIHRDYAPVDGSVSVAIYTDRVEVWNIGDLPEGMEIRELKQLHASRPRNPDIAHLFMLHGQIERIGSGTRRIVREFRAAGLPEPEWRRTSGGIMLLLPREKKTGLIASVEDLNARQRAVVKGLKTGESIKLADYIGRSPEKIKDRQARADLKGLVEMGFMRRRGQARQTEYVRTEKQLE